MTSPWMAAALAVLAPAALAADPADPADPAAPVPAPQYRSVFTGPAGVEEETVDWKKANADVAQFPRGHIDLLRWEEQGLRHSREAGNPGRPDAPGPRPRGEDDGKPPVQEKP